MKKITRPLCCLLMAVLMTTTLIVPIFADRSEQADQGQVIYLEEYGGYYVKNVSPQEIIEAFDDDPQFTYSGEECCVAESIASSKSDTVAEAAFASVGRDYDETMAATFERTYQLTANATGVFGETVTITYTAILLLKTVKVQGKNYESFVELELGPTPTLPSGIYTLGTGTSDPKGEIINSGATFKISQIVQLETAIPVALSAGIVLEVVQSSVTAGGTVYIRLKPVVLTQRVTLPIYNVIY